MRRHCRKILKRGRKETREGKCLSSMDRDPSWSLHGTSVGAGCSLQRGTGRLSLSPAPGSAAGGQLVHRKAATTLLAPSLGF